VFGNDKHAHTTQTNTVLSLSNVHIHQGAFSLRNITLSVTQGDIFGFVGRSGSGKSTLIKAILGLQPHYKGTINLLQGLTTLNIHEMLGYSPQDDALYPNLTIQENCEVFGGLNGLHMKQVYERMHTLLIRFKLQGHEHKRVSELSGGMRKRADLLVAILHDPNILILDEPFAGLDISVRAFIWELLIELASQQKIIILTTHDIEDVRDHCTNFGVLYENTFYGKKDVLAHLHGDAKHLPEYVKHLFNTERL
jgi:ABC-2 type transport system ATP-binding protein